jgi:hypothetical protein
MFIFPKETDHDPQAKNSSVEADHSGLSSFCLFCGAVFEIISTQLGYVARRLKVKVIFLDVDGVLNNHVLVYHYGSDYIDEGLVELLGTVVKSTGAELVLSSSWRLGERSMNVVKVAIGRFGMELFGRTAMISGGRRCDEIKAWLDENPGVGGYAILDDDCDASCGVEENFFMTDPDVGLTNEIANKVRKHLGNQKENE